MENRPKSRKRNYSGKSVSVFSSSTSNSGSNIIRGGSGLSLIGIVLFVIYSLVFKQPTTNTQSIINTLPVSSAEYNIVNDKEVNYSVDDLSREKYTILNGDGSDKVTIMIYMVGSDLESRYGMATKDLNEILYAKINNENLNIVVETGGAKTWQNSVIKSGKNQRYLINNKGMSLIDDKVGLKNMSEPDTLSDFINFASKKYPANRNILIMWDHGAGSVNGFGYDEYFPGNTMSIDEISSALKKGGVKFDFVGFDACLMATLENAISLKSHADYLIASEEVEPGTGWYYTNWISALNDNTSISTLDLSKLLIDDYISSSTSTKDQLTLSITDLSELESTLVKSLKDFSKNLSETIKSDNFKVVSDARSLSKEFSKSSRLDQIDLYDFAMKINSEESLALANVIKSAVKYNRSKNISNAHGLSIYFPYSSLNKMNNMVKIYDNIDIDEDYSMAVKNFATLTSSGQIVVNNSGSSHTSLIDTLLNNTYSSQTNVDISSMLNDALNGDFSQLLGGSDWLDISSLSDIAQIIGRNSVNQSSFEISQINGKNVLSLSEEEWKLIKDIELNVFIDDGNGFIDLGLDNTFDFNENGDLIIDYDKSWLALNDNIVSYKMLSTEVNGDYYKIQGYIPAYLNDEFVNIMVEFSSENENGVVLGARKVYDDAYQEAKGLIDIVEGDKLQFVCDYHSYDGKKVEKHFLNDVYVVSNDLTLSNIYINNPNLVYSYRLTDIYNNHYWLKTFRSE